eukprot:gene8648-17842_t
MGASSTKGYSVNARITPEATGPGLHSGHEYHHHVLKRFWNSDPPLIRACRKGNAALVTELIKKSSNSPFTTKNKQGDTALIMASKKGQYTVAKILLEWIKKTNHGKDAISEENKDGETALLWACRKGHVALIVLLLEHGAFSLENSKEKSLIWASENDQLGLMSLILQLSAQCGEDKPPTDGIEVKDEYVADMGGRECVNTSLHITEGLTKELIAQKNNQKKQMRALFMRTLMSLIMRRGTGSETVSNLPVVKEELAKELIAHSKAEKSSFVMRKLMKVASSEENVNKIKPLLSERGPLDTRDEDGNTALMWACKNLNIPAIKLLIEHGASVNVPDNNHDTPLIYICKQRLPARFLAVGERSISEEKASTTYKNIATVEEFLQRHVDIAQELLKSVGPIDRKNEDGDTALILACKNKNCKSAGIVTELLKAGALVDETDNRGRTALMFACRNGHEEKVKALLEFKADVNLRDKSDGPRSVIWYAVGKATKLIIVQLLLEAGVKEDLSCLITCLRVREKDPNAVQGRGNQSFASSSPRSSSNRTMYKDEDLSLIIDALAKYNPNSDKKEEVKVGCISTIQKDDKPPKIPVINIKNKNGNEELVKLLLEQKEKNIEVNITNKNRDTPLIAASKEGHTENVKHLIDLCGRDVEFDLQNNEGNTALHYASTGGHLDIVNMLLKIEANTSLKNRNNEVPLAAMCAVEILKPLHIEIAKSLLKPRKAKEEKVKKEIGKNWINAATAAVTMIQQKGAE